MLVGVVSDTHGYLDPRLVEALRGVDVILHAGDVGSSDVLERLGEMAPIIAVQGNNDMPLGGLGLETHLNVTLGGVTVHLVHELPHARPTDLTRVIVFGHSHRQLYENRSGIAYLNPGAAGRQGFHKLQTAALMRIDSGHVEVDLLTLGPREKSSSTAR